MFLRVDTPMPTMVLQTRLREETLDHIMDINVDGLSLDNFDTREIAFDWLESTVTSRHLAIIHLEQKHMKKLMKTLLLYRGKTK